MAEYNPRYVLYARSKGHEASEQIEIDRQNWPGGCMTGFIIWIANAKQVFAIEHPEATFDGKIADQDKFDQFLSNLLRRS